MNTIRQLQQKWKNKITPGDQEILLAEILGENISFIIAHPEYRVAPRQYRQWQKFAKLRQKGYSVAAIIGHKEFFGLDFFVNKNVLIPRPETELIVEEALKKIKQNIAVKFLIDVGTGTACIPVAILKNTNKKITALATDRSAAALRLAKKNAAKHKVKIKFFEGNLLEPVKKYLTGKKIRRTGFLITANLPYLTAKQFKSEPSIQKEPRAALVADSNDGLSLYEQLFKQMQKFLLLKNIFLFIEIDPCQSRKADKLIQNYFPFAKFEIKKDLSGRDRVVMITTKG